MYSVRRINQMLRDAERTGKNVYARNLQINSLGLISEEWKRVYSAKTLYGEAHCRTVNPTWSKVIASTNFDVR